MVLQTGEGSTQPEVSMEPPTRAFAHYSGTLARASSIAHWQLRDLVCCVSNPRASNSSSFSSAASVSSSLRDDDDYDPQLFVVRHCSTLRHSLRDRKSSVAQALPFAPTSMTAGHGYVAAGGQHGQLDVRRLSDGAVVLRGAAGGSVNNALALAPSSTSPGGDGGGVTLFVCNNDCSIKAYALPPVPSGVAPLRSANGSRRRRGVRGGGGGGGRGGRRNNGGGENDENEMMTLGDGEEEEEENNDCDDDFSDQDEDNAAAVAASEDVVAAAFEDHHYDSLEQQREAQEQQRRRRRRQQTNDNSNGNNGNVEAGMETLMASLEARVAAAVAAAVGAAATTIDNNNNAGDNALRPTSANNDNVAAGGGNFSAALLRRRANANANATNATSTASGRAARLAASSPAAVVRCLDPVNYCAPSPPHARGVPGFSNSNGTGTTTTISPATLAAVGDCPSLSLHAPTESGYSPLASWGLFDDAGMACAWSASGSFVAAAAQCGTVVCVDPRVGRRAVMRRNVLLPSSPSSSSSSNSVVARWRTPGGGAARALKASPAGSATDLLLLTEHDTFAHLVDARRFDRAQTLEVGLGRGNNGSETGGENSGGGSSLFGLGGSLFYGSGGLGSGGNHNSGLGSSSGPTANGGHHLSGAAFSPEGDLAFVGAEDGGVAVFDVRTAERCCVGECGYR